MAWTFAMLGQSDEKLFAALAIVAERRVSYFNAQELASMAWASAKAGQADE